MAGTVTLSAETLRRLGAGHTYVSGAAAATPDSIEDRIVALLDGAELARDRILEALNVLVVLDAGHRFTVQDLDRLCDRLAEGVRALPAGVAAMERLVASPRQISTDKED